MNNKIRHIVCRFQDVLAASTMSVLLSVDGVWSEWQTMSSGPCSVSCDGGVRQITLERTCIGPAFGGKDCKGDKRMTRTSSCNTHTCSGIAIWQFILISKAIVNEILTVFT